jgi:hypothetical protein
VLLLRALLIAGAALGGRGSHLENSLALWYPNCHPAPMPDKSIQRSLPFSELEPVAVTPAADRSEPSEAALVAYERLQNWLLDPQTGRAATDLAAETLRAVDKALLDGNNDWVLAAEDGLEALKMRNGKTQGEDIPSGVTAGDDFPSAVDDVLACLQQRSAVKGLVRGRKHLRPISWINVSPQRGCRSRPASGNWDKRWNLRCPSAEACLFSITFPSVVWAI